MINNFVDSRRPPIEVIGWCDSFSDFYIADQWLGEVDTRCQGGQGGACNYYVAFKMILNVYFGKHEM